MGNRNEMPSRPEWKETNEEDILRFLRISKDAMPDDPRGWAEALRQRVGDEQRGEILYPPGFDNFMRERGVDPITGELLDNGREAPNAYIDLTQGRREELLRYLNLSPQDATRPDSALLEELMRKMEDPTAKNAVTTNEVLMGIYEEMQGKSQS